MLSKAYSWQYWSVHD